jgi:amino acid transporter
MMDGLELLKKDWKKNEPRFEQVSVKDIYAMLHKKSSSIVKILLYVSVAELIFWILIGLIPLFSSSSYNEQINLVYKNDTVFYIANAISYGIIILFVYLLYKAYKDISVTDTVKGLMQRILKTRKIIQYYVIYNLTIAFIAMILGSYYGIVNNPEIYEQFNGFNQAQIIISIGIIIVFTLIFVLLVWVFYRILYGILIRRLLKNYKELKKLEV